MVHLLPIAIQSVPRTRLEPAGESCAKGDLAAAPRRHRYAAAMVARSHHPKGPPLLPLVGLVVALASAAACDKTETEQLQLLAEQHELGDEVVLERMARALWGGALQSVRFTGRDGQRSLRLDIVYGDRPETTLDKRTFTSSTLKHLAGGACQMIRFGRRRGMAELRLSVLTRVGNRQSPVELYRTRLSAAAVQPVVKAGCTAKALETLQTSWQVEVDRSDRLRVHP